MADLVLYISAGSWIIISIFKPTGWETEMNLMSNVRVALPGLGDEAFSTKRPTDAEDYISKEIGFSVLAPAVVALQQRQLRRKIRQLEVDIRVNR